MRAQQRIRALEAAATAAEVRATAADAAAGWEEAAGRWMAAVAAGIDPGPVPVPRPGAASEDWRRGLIAAAAVGQVSFDDLRAVRLPPWVPEDCHAEAAEVFADVLGANALLAASYGLTDEQMWESRGSGLPKEAADA